MKSSFKFGEVSDMYQEEGAKVSPDDGSSPVVGAKTLLCSGKKPF